MVWSGTKMGGNEGASDSLLHTTQIPEKNIRNGQKHDRIVKSTHDYMFIQQIIC